MLYRDCEKRMIVETRAVSARAMRVVALLVILASLLAGRQAAAFHEETLVSGAPGSQTDGRTDGTWVVWLDRGEDPVGNARVYAARLDDRVVFPVTTGTRNETMPDIDNGVVVWAEYNDDDSAWSILATDLASGEQSIVARSTIYPNPRISGTRIVWSDHDPESRQPMLLTRDIRAADEPIVLAPALADAEGMWNVEVAGTHIIWWEGFFRDHSWSWWIRTVEMAGADPGTPVTIATGGMYPPSFDVGGDIAVYSNSLDLIVVDLTSGATRRIDEPSPPLPITPRDPTTDGRYVFWQDDLYRDGDLHASLMGFDLVTDTVFTIIADVGMYRSLQPDTAAGYLVWQTGSDRERDVHAAPLVDLLPDRDWTYFPETSHYLTGRFRDFWEANGGLPVFGYPLTEEFVASSIDTGTFSTVQYVERQRFEWHPENAGTPYDVLLGRLGVEVLEQQDRNWTDFERADPDTPHYVPETGHAIAELFYAYWSSHGLDFGDSGISYRESLALFGYPISEPMLETNADGDTVLTQYFERAVFEYHPDNPAEYQVLLRRVGAEVLDARGW